MSRLSEALSGSRSGGGGTSLIKLGNRIKVDCIMDNKNNKWCKVGKSYTGKITMEAKSMISGAVLFKMKLDDGPEIQLPCSSRYIKVARL